MLTFQHLLGIAGLPLKDVRLLRHQDSRKTGFPSPYVLWRDHRNRFEEYQSTQSHESEGKLRGRFWASFVGTPAGETLFVGLYETELVGPIPSDRPHPQDASDIIHG